MEFQRVPADESPARELIDAMVAEINEIYGRSMADDPRSPSATPADFAPPGGACLVGFDDGGAAVCVGGVKRLEPGVAEIKRMYVLPEARGRGAARALLGALEGAARDLGYARVRLDTGRSAAARAVLVRERGLPVDRRLQRQPVRGVVGRAGAVRRAGAVGSGRRRRRRDRAVRERGGSRWRERARLSRATAATNRSHSARCAGGGGPSNLRSGARQSAHTPRQRDEAWLACEPRKTRSTRPRWRHRNLSPS